MTEDFRKDLLIYARNEGEFLPKEIEDVFERVVIIKRKNFIRDPLPIDNKLTSYNDRIAFASWKFIMHDQFYEGTIQQGINTYILQKNYRKRFFDEIIKNGFCPLYEPTIYYSNERSLATSELVVVMRAEVIDLESAEKAEFAYKRTLSIPEGVSYVTRRTIAVTQEPFVELEVIAANKNGYFDLKINPLLLEVEKDK